MSRLHTPGKRLLVTVHDVSPKHMDRLRTIDSLLQDNGIEAKYGMLVVPNFWNDWAIEDHPDFCAWLRSREEAGVEMILHGFYHRDLSAHLSLTTAFKAAVMTAREGEFLGLDHDTAVSRIRDGQAILGKVLQKAPKGFIAPAWLYGEGAHSALKATGIPFAEDHMKVWNPVTGQLLSRSPVISYASRSLARIASSLAWSRIAPFALHAARDVRIAIHPHDVDVPSLVREMKRLIRLMLKTRAPTHYCDLDSATSLA